MIAAQLLAYYFTELKDDQLKKVSDNSFKLSWWSFYIRLQSFVISQQPSVYPQTQWLHVGIESMGCIMLGEEDAPFDSYGRRKPAWCSVLIWCIFSLLAVFDTDVLEQGCGHWSWWNADRPPSLSFSGALVAMASEADRCLWGVVGKSQDLKDDFSTILSPIISVYFSQSFSFTLFHRCSIPLHCCLLNFIPLLVHRENTFQFFSSS